MKSLFYTLIQLRWLGPVREVASSYLRYISCKQNTGKLKLTGTHISMCIRLLIIRLLMHIFSPYVAAECAQRSYMVLGVAIRRLNSILKCGGHHLIVTEVVPIGSSTDKSGNPVLVSVRTRHLKGLELKVPHRSVCNALHGKIYQFRWSASCFVDWEGVKHVLLTRMGVKHVLLTRMGVKHVLLTRMGVKHVLLTGRGFKHVLLTGRGFTHVLLTGWGFKHVLLTGGVLSTFCWLGGVLSTFCWLGGVLSTFCLLGGVLSMFCWLGGVLSTFCWRVGF